MAERSDLRILIVDDDPDLARLLRGTLYRHGFVVVEHVTTGEAALEAAPRFDVILLDHQLPDVAGADLLATLRARPDPPAVVMVTAHGSESLAAAALRRGADDYLVKDAALTELLPQVLERVRRERALREALAAAQRDLVRAERLAAVGEMTVTLHHEINNPLMAASAEVELLLAADDGHSPARREGLEATRQALGRIAEILRRSGELRRANATEYSGGVKMIDLGPEAAAPAVPGERGVAAVFVADEKLASVVELLLHRARYQVARCGDMLELRRALGAPATRLLVYAPSADHPPIRVPPAGERAWRAVALVPPGGDAAARADLVVPIPFDPAALGQQIGRLAG